MSSPPCALLALPSWLQATTDLLSDSVDLPVHTNGIIQDVVFCVWLPSLSIMFSRFVHVVVCVSISFLSIA